MVDILRFKGFPGVWDAKRHLRPLSSPGYVGIHITGINACAWRDDLLLRVLVVNTDQAFK